MAEDVKLHYEQVERTKKEKLDKHLKHKQELEKLIEQRQKIAEYIANSQSFLEAKRKKDEENQQA